MALQTNQVPTTAMTDGNRWFKVSDVARITSMSRSKIYQLMDAGSLKSVKVGGSRRVTELDLAEFMASFTTQEQAVPNG